MPAAEYEHRTDSVLAWKKAQKLGRFDPDAPSIEQQKIRASEREVEERGKPYDFPHVLPTVEPYVGGNRDTGARSSTWITARLLCHDLFQCTNRRCFKHFPKRTPAYFQRHRGHDGHLASSWQDSLCLSLSSSSNEEICATGNQSSIPGVVLPNPSYMITSSSTLHPPLGSDLRSRHDSV
jgi:hypothetical protein